ncbi:MULTISPECIES: PilZ domain-containing protein [Gammaproteobacteria]|uniref:PilZ domain-containing protein n=1 Tax=Gammaproteobacteria TaxID=1236 RepID=UPI000DCF99F3|nr:MULTISPECIES: PilZ domain-containing protein [Gammaproteobacteria]RTE85600.1 PilZ domain-containing protein [Aliidiomarina sp. B3213]TCZ89569.1 PilZ domain-containing protein [Lysobacter sp. N42]
MSAEGFTPSIRPVPVEMELRFGTHNERVKGLLVGQRQPEYLAVEISKKYNWNEVNDWFGSCATVVIRGVLNQGQIVAAATGFLSSITRPQRIVFLQYPKRFEARGLRQAPRIEVELDATIRPAPSVPSPFPQGSGIEEVQGTIKDISRGGMGFSAKADPTISADKLNGGVVEVEIKDGEKSLLKTVAEIRGSKQSGVSMVMGLLIDKKDQAYLDALDDLVLHSKLIKQAIHG